MKKPLVVLAHRFQKEIIDRKLKPFARVRVATEQKKLHTAIRDADALVTCFVDPVQENLLRNSRKLRCVANVAVGFDNIDLEACQKRGIRVVNTPGVLTRATAELSLGLLLAAARRFHEGETLCRKNQFKGWEPELLVGLELRGRRAVLVGKGRIGKETGKLFRAIGMRVEWILPRESESSILKKLKGAQVLSLHVPLNRSTFHWLNSKRISVLPKDAIVINTARGPVIDEKALIRALKKKRIFSAGLDVFENEPQIPSALRRIPNIVLLPHIGSATRAARDGMLELAISGMLGILSGKRPWNEVKFQP